MSKEYNTPYMREHRRKCKEKGTCIHCCSRHATPGFTSCDVCRDAIRIRMSGKTRVKILRRPPKPEICPLCENSDHTVLYWHHWNDSKPEVGMWLCPHCNAMVELDDRELVDKYRELQLDAIADTLT